MQFKKKKDLDKKDQDVLQEAADLVEHQLDVMETLGEARKHRPYPHGHLLCRCPRCLAEANGTIEWVKSMRAGPRDIEAERHVPKLTRRPFGQR